MKKNYLLFQLTMVLVALFSSVEFANAQNDRIQQYLRLLQSELNLLNSHIELKKIQGKL